MKNVRKVDLGKISGQVWRIFLFPVAIAVSLGGAIYSGNAAAKKPGCEAPPCKGPPPVVETAANNLSFPVIMSDNTPPGGFAVTYPFMIFADVASTSDCTTGTAGGPVPVEFLCYFDGATVWWLQQRTANKWQAYPPEDPDTSTPVDVTAVDVGDKLESALALNSKQIRTEFTLLMNATTDPDFADGVLDVFDSAFTENTFQAFNMSGAVPGTDQSINEIQGTDYGPGEVYPSQLGGTGAMVDPTLVKLTNEGIPVHATVYSHCARLVIQKITDPDNLVWSSNVDDGNGRGGYWVGGALPPQENLAAWDGSYSAEINAGGTLIYGFNWNTKLIDQSIKSGTWRLSFVLEGDTDDSGRCSVDLNTVFESTTTVNVGEQNLPVVLTPGDMSDLGATNGEGGMVYIDVPLSGGGGGGKIK